jgi:type II secretion system protein G
MGKQNKGFTLIELLVVVAVVGILAALVIPNAILSIQKAKQKQTMKEIVTIATAVASYATDAGAAPDAGNQAGPLLVNSNFVRALSPTYIKFCPINDRWGNPYRVYSGNAVAGVYSIPAEGLGGDDFLIVSLGSDKKDGGTVTYTYQPTNLAAGLYSINSMEDFKNDLINFDGSWLHAPRIMISGSGT